MRFFASPPDAVLEFEAAGIVDAVGPSVLGVQEGDEVASLLSTLGGYGEYALASSWTPKPPRVTWGEAAALPASAEAALGTLKQLGLTGVRPCWVLGAAGSPGVRALRLRRQRHLPMDLASQAHRLLESGAAHQKLILDAP